MSYAGTAVGSEVLSPDPPGSEMTPTEPATTEDLLRRPLSELAALVRSGEVSSRELVELSLETIEAHNGALNAFTHVDACLLYTSDAADEL